MATENKINKYTGYEDRKQLSDFLAASYRGGPEYRYASDAHGYKVFIKHEFEIEDRVARRIRHATYKNYCRTIVDKYRDYVYRGDIKWPVAGDDTPKLSLFLADCDNNGTPLKQFMRNATKAAQIHGEVLVGIDHPPTPEDEKLTQAQAEAAGIRFYLTLVDIRQMVDYEEDNSGFTRIVIKETSRVKPSLSVKEESVVTYVEYYPDGWKRYDKDGQPIGAGKHTVGVVPFWRYKYNPDGDSQILDIAECSRKIFNLSSLLDEELYSRTFSQIIVSGDIVAGDVKDIVGGNSNILFLPTSQGGNVSVDVIGADTNQARSIMDTISSEVKEVFRQAGIESGDPTETGEPESGEARAWAFHSVEQQLATIASGAEHTVNVLLYQLERLGAIEPSNGADFPESFDVTSFKDELESALTMTTIDHFPLTATKEILRRLVFKFLPKIEAEKQDAINEEIDAIEDGPTMDFSRVTEEDKQ